MNRTGTLPTAIAISLFVLSLLSIPAVSRAGTRSDAPSLRNCIDIQAGYFIGRRSIFRDLYGNNLTLGVGCERRYNKTHGLALRVGYTRLDKLALVLRTWTVAPCYTFTFFENSRFRAFAGLGAGLSNRKISYAATVDYFGIIEEVAFSWNETAFYGLSMVGVNVRLLPRLSTNIRISYDYHRGKDTDIGGYGDTGGLSLTGGIGFSF